MPQAHLDRPFDYLVPERLADQARPGVKVRVRFAGTLIDGFLIERVEESEHHGSLRYLERVLSTEQVLTDEIASLARAVADRYAGTLADVLRLAIPQRHAATEAPQAPHPGGACSEHGEPPAAPGPRPVDKVPGGTVVPRRDRRGPPGPRGLDGASRSRLAGRDRAGRRHRRKRGPGRGHRGPRRP